MRRIASLVFAGVCVLALMFGVVAASAAPSRTWTNDFEMPGDDTPAGDWYPNGPATITRTPSGAAATYASGIQSASGNWHARLRHNSICLKVQASFACSGPFTYWGKGNGFNPVFPDGGYVTEISIYLDVAWMAADPAMRHDTRFDWSSAINNQTGTHKADLVFNAGTPLTPAETATSPGYYVNASTNAFRNSAFPQNPCPDPSAPPNSCRTPVKITDSGWYVFQHYFHRTTIGGVDYLAVDMSVRQLNGGVVASWTIYIAEGATGVGGDRYGWFAIQEIQDLAADCSTLHRPGIPPGLSCPQPVPGRVTGGGQINVPDGRGTFGFNARSENGGASSGHLTYKNHATGADLNCTVTLVEIFSPTQAHLEGTCSSNSSAPSFSAEVEDNDEPGKNADRFVITYGTTTEGGPLRAGNIQIHLEPTAATSSQSNEAAVVGAGESTSQGGTFNGVSVTGLEVGTGVSIASTGAATGQLLVVLQGTSALGQRREIEVDGKVGTGSVGLDGSATLSGSATVDMGDGVVLQGVPFTVTATAGSLLLSLGTTTLPSATLTGGSITID